MSRIRILALFAVLTLAVGLGQADNWVTIQKSYAEYGHLYNTDNGTAGGIPKPWCAPTATANSFQYLVNHYPDTFGNLLNNNTLLQTRDKLCQGWLSPGGVWRGGTGINGATDKDWWESKAYWVEDYAGAGYEIGGMVSTNPAGWHDSQFLTFGAPTWQWLWNKLSLCADIELGIDIGESMGHAVDLTSMKFNDLNFNGVWDYGEYRQLDFLDPNNPTALWWGDVTQDLVGGQLQFWWDNHGANAPTWATIHLGYYEIPEPTSVLLIVVGVLLARRR
jgi:hypothetical protein